MTRLNSTRSRLGRQRGLSLVELMVGITVGLFVVAAATALVANQLTDNRRLLLETQIHQDLRMTMDIITRQLRRAGANTLTGVESTVSPGPDVGGLRNVFSDTAIDNFALYFDSSQQRPFGYKRTEVAGVGVIQTSLPRSNQTGNWQDLTDSRTLDVTRFIVTSRVISSSVLPCPKECPGGGTACWPQVQVRDFVVEITGRSRSDASVQRSLRNEVRIRNDALTYPNPAATTALCPA